MTSKFLQAFVFTGPSGAGKSTLLDMLLKQFRDTLRYSISHTTRKPRKQEVDGEAYYFVTPTVFEKMIENNEFIEYSKFSSNYYGTSYKELSNQNGKIPILDVNLQGVITLQKANLYAKYILIKPPSFEFLESNLRKRGTETEPSIMRRLKHAEEDMKTAQNVHFDLVIENKDLKVSFEKLKEFIQNELDSQRSLRSSTTTAGKLKEEEKESGTSIDNNNNGNSNKSSKSIKSNNNKIEDRD